MSFATRLSRVADRVAAAAGWLQKPLSAEELLALARRRAGLHDYGDMEFVDPLRRFLMACHEEANLNLIGQLATRWDVMRFLSNLLRFRAAETACTAILEQPITRPIFITGLPRSGTTFLHKLLMQDPATLTPRVWQTIYPYPMPRAMFRADNRTAAVQRQLRAFESLAPEFRALHPIDADSPQECSEINAHVFSSLRFDTTYQIPSYRAWLDAAGHIAPYRFHKRFLQHLQHQNPDYNPSMRWIVKCPDHVFALDAIRVVYPDARIVFMHRDPLKVLLSVAKLTEVLRAPFSRDIDPARIGLQESRRYVEATRRMMQASTTNSFQQPIMHIRHEDLVANPLATVRALYRQFDLEIRPETLARISEFSRRAPNGGYGPRHYRFEDHGLDPRAERGKFAEYVAAFGLQT
jgi:hypothetical protein